MKDFTVKKNTLLQLVFAVQVVSLLFYLSINIVNVGSKGSALPLLAVYFLFSIFIFLVLWVQKKLYFRFHFFVFLLLISWIAVRILFDLGDLDLLVAYTVATSGGMLLFYFAGSLLWLGRQCFIVGRNKYNFNRILLFCFFMALLFVLYSFSQRLHPRIFYLEDVNGAYQRPGNFLSIIFLMFSFLYLNLVLNILKVGLAGFFWLLIYSVSTVMALTASQLFGSNSATAVILGVYLITLVMSLILSRKAIWLHYLKKQLALPWSKRLLMHLGLMSLLGLVFFIGALFFVIAVTGFDITSMRLFGFGSGTNSSILSRIEIILETGSAQLSFAPFLGDMNVAYLTTGNSGQTLHSFFPYVLANLGFVGLIILLILFTSLFLQLYREVSNKKTLGLDGYQISMMALYSTFVFIYILFLANISTGITWAVLWFAFGFVSRPFGFK